MKRERLQYLRLAAVAALSASSMTASAISAWPQSAGMVKIVVPFAAGGAADTLARVLAEQIRHTQGQTVIVENRPGAGTVIATESVSRAAPDGDTVLLVSNSFLINAQLRKQNYDPITGFAPVCYLVRSPQLILVSSASPYRTLADLVDRARAEPSQITMASIGPGSTQHIAFELFRRRANIDMTYVSYSAAAPVLNALLGQHVTSAFADYAIAGEQLKAGKLRALATASRARIASLPNVPTVAESGYPDFEVEVWYGLVAPARTPAEKVSQLAGWLTGALQVPEVKDKLEAMGLYLVGTCGAEFAAHIRSKYEEYGRIIRETNLKLE